MKKMLIRRLIQMVILLFLVSIICFAIIQLAPGDISNMYIREGMSEAQKASIKHMLGVDRSPIEQYMSWLQETLSGNLGVSLSNFQPVATQILTRLPATVLLMGSSLIVSLLVAIPLGLFAGYRSGSRTDQIISGFTCIGMSVPSFWLGIVFVVIFSVNLGLFPTNGMHSTWVESVFDVIWHLILPVITLSIGNVASFTQYIRSSVINELEEDYVLMARSKGTSEKRILTGHVLKNSLLPVITLVGMSLSSLVGGSVVIESLFGWPGLGTLALAAIRVRDYPMIMAFTLITCAALVIGNFIADILYMIVDPRIRQGMKRNYER